MKSLFIIISSLFLFFGLITQSSAECRKFRAVAIHESQLEATYNARVRRNLQAINRFGRRRMCGHARHTERCNRYLKRNVTCRVGVRVNRIGPVYRCTATGTVCRINRRRRQLLDFPENFLGPFNEIRPNRRKKNKRKFHNQQQYRR